MLPVATKINKSPSRLGSRSPTEDHLISDLIDVLTIIAVDGEGST